jgi:O-antigen/teichoic acid export membrane protein
MINQVLNHRTISRIRASSVSKQAIGTLGVKVLMVVLSLTINIVLARTVGTKGFGIYTYALAWATILQILADIGMIGLITRQTAVYAAKLQWDYLNGLLKWSGSLVLKIATGISLVAIATVLLLEPKLGIETSRSLAIAFLAIPYCALTTQRQAATRGLQHAVLGQIPEFVLQPLLFLLFLAFAIATGTVISIPNILLVRVSTIIISFFVGVLLLRRCLPSGFKKSGFSFEVSNWQRAILPFIVVAFTSVACNRAGILILGMLKGYEAVGIYNVVSRGIDLLGFIYTSFSISMGPTIAKLYAQEEPEKLQQFITRTTRSVFLLTLPFGCLLILLGHWYLLAFGKEFLSGYWALTILVISQLFNIGSGEASLILSMTNNEAIVSKISIFNVVTNVVTTFLFVPDFGLEGLAFSSAISMFTTNALFIYFLKRRLKINSTILFTSSS